MSERIIAITGATDGLGKVVATALAADPETRLILHGRSTQRLEALRTELSANPAQVDTVRADLSELAQVHQLADDIAAHTGKLTVLVNNAGVGFGEPDGTTRRLTGDGNELRFAVNYLAPFALTQRLVPLLKAGAPARIVHIASIGQAPLDFDDLTLEHHYTGQLAYRRSKLALITYGLALAKRLDPQQVTVNSVHPGTYMPTKMVLDAVGHSIDSLDTGVAAVLRLIGDPFLTGVTGRYYERTTEAQARPEAYLAENQQRLWQISEELTALPDRDLPRS
ncbi:SDR family NAD(P)-dependent oxidoreductase [Nesterenkonia ebinurensis]|uniref:SDR family NAD(P)-dependent oxidoreductase n=1 Tax=Nesterenkonia ebinurensis TaxID=2608252 RepID=UPI00123D1601|nr:SDR family NAD(P)-dependent oxidoreductase [Nesterenkonia ebinurensis]